MKKIKEFFVVAATDDCGFRIEEFIKANSPREALEEIRNNAPLGDPLLFADVYESADAYHRDRRPLATLYRETSEYYRRHRKPIECRPPAEKLNNPELNYIPWQPSRF